LPNRSRRIWLFRHDLITRGQRHGPNPYVFKGLNNMVKIRVSIWKNVCKNIVNIYKKHNHKSSKHMVNLGQTHGQHIRNKHMINNRQQKHDQILSKTWSTIIKQHHKSAKHIVKHRRATWSAIVKTNGQSSSNSMVENQTELLIRLCVFYQICLLVIFAYFDSNMLIPQTMLALGVLICFVR
jgi:hypothetical protein